MIMNTEPACVEPSATATVLPTLNVPASRFWSDARTQAPLEARYTPFSEVVVWSFTRTRSFDETVTPSTVRRPDRELMFAVEATRTGYRVGLIANWYPENEELFAISWYPGFCDAQLEFPERPSARLLKPTAADVPPVPPFATGRAVPLKVTARVPDVVIGEPDTDRNDGTDIATDVTVPEPLGGAANVPSARRKFVVPPPEAGT